MISPRSSRSFATNTPLPAASLSNFITIGNFNLLIFFIAIFEFLKTSHLAVLMFPSLQICFVKIFDDSKRALFFEGPKTFMPLSLR